jgi:hypothetical protein
LTSSGGLTRSSSVIIVLNARFPVIRRLTRGRTVTTCTGAELTSSTPSYKIPRLPSYPHRTRPGPVSPPGTTVQVRFSRILWGLNIGLWACPASFGCPVGSCCDLLLAGEPVEDRSTANVVADEVDHVWWLGVGLGGCELRERSVWPCLVEMVQVRGEDLP